ncbi:MAG: FAD-dependent oxidoreductase [Sulfobacillus thermotolerans]|nr:FAD-dependent oxidoreductase [Sulfobacillus thermotolerans]
MVKRSVGIIGGGLAGLTAAAFLTQEGWSVDVFERADAPGGCASDYLLGGCRFPTGATIAFGLEEHGALQKLLTALDINVTAHVLHHPLDIVLADRAVGIYTETSVQTQEWQQKFPSIAPQISRLFHQSQLIADSLYALAKVQLSWPLSSWHDVWIAASTLWQYPRSWWGLARYFTQPWRSLLSTYHLYPPKTPDQQAFMQMLDALLIDSIQTTSENASALMASLALDMYRRGSYTITGGLRTLADALVQRIERSGGRLHYRSIVKMCRWDESLKQWSINTGPQEPNECSDVINATGRPLPGPSAHVTHTPWSPMTPSTGAFRVDGVIARRHLPLPLASHLPRSFQIVLPDITGRPSYLHGAVYLTFHHNLCSNAQDILWTATAHTAVQYWHPRLPRSVYHARKEQAAAQVMAACDRVLPHLAALSSAVYVATPVTYYRFLHKHGVGGIPLTAQQLLHIAGSRTAHPHLYQAGDTVFPGPGTLSAVLSGFLAAQSVVGHRIRLRSS